MTEPKTGDVTRTDAERIDSLETKVDSHDGKLDEILGLIKGGIGGRKDGDGDEGPPARPGSVREQVRAELAAHEAEAKRQADSDSTKSEVASLREQVAALAERRPEIPQRRRERFMWGKR